MSALTADTFRPFVERIVAVYLGTAFTAWDCIPGSMTIENGIARWRVVGTCWMMAPIDEIRGFQFHKDGVIE